jgi:hypothetical protein
MTCLFKIVKGWLVCVVAQLVRAYLCLSIISVRMTIGCMVGHRFDSCLRSMEERVYIAGKITGNNDYAILFEEAENHLKSKGYKLISNPVKVCSHLQPHIHTWEQYMITCIEELFKCKIIFMLKNWRESKGASIEHDIAKRMGLAVIYQD